MKHKESVIIVWDKDGEYFQTWTAKYKQGDGISHGIRIAKLIKGTYIVVPRSK